MSDRKTTTKKPLKELIKLIVPLILIVGIPIGSIYLPYNNVDLVFLHAWLLILDFDIMALDYTCHPKTLFKNCSSGDGPVV